MDQLTPTGISARKKSNPVIEAKSRATKLNGPVVWALDPALPNEKINEFKDQFSSDYGIGSEKIHLISLYSPFDLGWVVKTSKKEKNKKLSDLEERMKIEWKLGQGSKWTPFVTHGSSLREKVLLLISFAKRKKAKLIVVGSGAASRSRLTGIGSFAENLVALSNIPVLVLGQKTKQLKPVKKILFPTDFSKPSMLAFDNVLELAKNLNSEVLLYHYINLQAGPIAYGVPWGSETQWLDDYWRVNEEMMNDEGKKWKKIASKAGVACEVSVDRSTGSLCERILATAKEINCDLLAMSVKRGPLSQVILGRNVRDIFADAQVPLYVLHTTAEKMKKH